MLDYETNHKISTIPKLIDVLKMVEKKGKETTPKRLPQRVFASIVVEMAIGRGIAKPTWSRRRRWHVMHHHLQVFMSLKLILFLLTTNGYTIPVVAHTYGLICRA